MQEIVSALLGLTPIPHSGGYDVVFDAGLGDQKFEIKSVRRGSRMVVYSWRLQKELNCGEDVWYAVASHRRQCRNPATAAYLWADLSAHLEAVILIPVKSVADLCQNLPLKFISEHRTTSGVRNGYQRKGYCNGYYCLAERDLFSLGLTRIRQVQAEIGGLPFSASVLKHFPTK